MNRSAGLPPSIDQASTSLGTSLGEFLGELDKAVGLTQSIAEELKAMSKAVDAGGVEHVLKVLEKTVVIAGGLAGVRLFGPLRSRRSGISVDPDRRHCLILDVAPAAVLSQRLGYEATGGWAH